MIKKIITLFIGLLVIILCLGCKSTNNGIPNSKGLPQTNSSTISISTNTPILTETIISTTTIKVPTYTDTPAIAWANYFRNLTATPVPPLVSHNWIPEDLLIILDGHSGDGGSYVIGNLPPGYMLFSDGNLYKMKRPIDLNAYFFLTTKLERKEICRMMNTIDQIGFFDYDPLSYISDPDHWNPDLMGYGGIEIQVNAWRSKFIKHYGVSSYIRFYEIMRYDGVECTNCDIKNYPIILPAMWDTYLFLGNYQPDDLNIYRSTRFGMWIEEKEDSENVDALPWPIKSIKLKKLVNNVNTTDNEPNQIINSKSLVLENKLFNDVFSTKTKYFIEEDKIYSIFIRPLLPYEYNPDFYLDNDEISCFPSDGIIDQNLYKR